MNNLFAELRRRNVFRVAGVYLVVGWLVIQVVANVAPLLGLPAWFGKAVIVLLGVGFPIAVLFAWAFEMTPEGLKRTADVPESESVAGKTGRRLDVAILVGVVLAAGLVIVDRLMPEAPAAPRSAGTQSAALQTQTSRRIKPKPPPPRSPFFRSRIYRRRRTSSIFPTASRRKSLTSLPVSKD